jgi:hypothetical protein
MQQFVAPDSKTNLLQNPFCRSVTAYQPFWLSSHCHLTCRLVQLEKYRPTIVDYIGNTEAVGRLRVIALNGNMPNPTFSGTGLPSCFVRFILLCST